MAFALSAALMGLMCGLARLLALAVKGVAHLVLWCIVYPTVVVAARLARRVAWPLRAALNRIGYTFVVGHLRRLP